MKKIGKYWRKIEDKIQCELCPHMCLIPEGKHGRCTLRYNINQELVLPFYNHCTNLQIDPIEKKPLRQFLPKTKTLSFGSIGCNLACRFCQNWSLSHPEQGSEMLFVTYSPQHIVSEALKLQLPSISYTYNEPIISIEFNLETAVLARKMNLKNIAVTAGYINEKPRQDFFSLMDATNIDLKGIDPNFYKRYCGATLDPVLETLKYVFHETSTWLEITNLIIPDLNDSNDNIEKLCKWVCENLSTEVPIHFSAFHPAGLVMDKKRTPRETLYLAESIAKSYGMKNIYLGNI